MATTRRVATHELLEFEERGELRRRAGGAEALLHGPHVFARGLRRPVGADVAIRAGEQGFVQQVEELGRLPIRRADEAVGQTDDAAYDACIQSKCPCTTGLQWPDGWREQSAQDDINKVRNMPTLRRQ